LYAQAPLRSYQISSREKYCRENWNRRAWAGIDRDAEATMPSSQSPDIVPYGADQTVYLVVDSFGSRDTVYRVAEFELADLETAIVELLAGRFNNPVRVIAYNTLEHWTEDVSAQIAGEIQSRCDIDSQPVPEHVRDFVISHDRGTPQPALRRA
jgi:hypothetical protein